MEHLDRDTLVLLHYGEDVPPGAREHLLRCEACRSERELLRRVLGAVDQAAETPELAPAWEEHLWNRLRWKLERRRDRSWVWAAAAAAVVVIAVLAGYRLAPRSTTTAPAPQRAATKSVPASTPEARERVLYAVVGDHLDRSERVLTEIKNSSAEAPPVVIADREAMEDLVRKNRLYVDAAYASGQTSLANTLEELQPLLLELARAPEKPSARDLQMLQKRIEKRGALLELRVAGEQIRQRQSRKS
ncbi:MAG TPA: hypothetical protein VJZ76_08800 [Thermoanaerobaculia bacterium]|nr:hypothetical protein [Thermoanaerobaculia bacterium]